MNTSRTRITTKVEDEGKNTFSVLTYNILADCHTIRWRSSYPYVKEDNLLKRERANSKRHLLTMKELNHFGCDVILLQEVDEWYSPLLEKELQTSGYEYIFHKKAGVPEGCSLCYRKDTFECIKIIRLVLHDEVKKICSAKGIPKDLMNQMERASISLIAALKDVKTGKYIICAGTHISYSSSNPALQGLHACLICQKMYKIREEMSSSLGVHCSDISVIFGGDFNAEPDHICTKLMKGKLTDAEMKTLETLTYTTSATESHSTKSPDNCHLSKYLSQYLKNPLKLSSAFFDVMGNEPVITNAVATYSGCLDYLFYTSDLKVASVVDIDPAVAELYSHGGPTEQFASDHLPLIAEFMY